MATVRILVACHKPTQRVPKSSLLTPIQVGTALTNERFPDYLHDDEGENISAKNLSYCELTAQYWAWKNLSADYYGFFHYRRYLYPDIYAKSPYVVKPESMLDHLEQTKYYNINDMKVLAESYDIILPKKENMHVTVREHYAKAPFHHEKDLTLAENIIRYYYPNYIPAMEAYLSGTMCYFGNIFIMRREVFLKYCEWLFPILEEFDHQVDLTGYGLQELRLNGYLGERLLGIYSFAAENSLRRLELPRVHFLSGREYYKTRVGNLIFSPGSYRRSLLKRILLH